MTSRDAYKPPAFLQVDVDGLWTVRQCYGRAVGDTFHTDPVWQQGMREFLALFDALRVKAGFFLVGRDLEVPSKRRMALEIAEAGHEIANHSYTHRIGLTKLKTDALKREIELAHDTIVEAGLPEPVGFRSPGYDVDERVLAVVRAMGYAYDASVLPSAMGPVMRIADAWIARRIQLEKRQFGRTIYVRAPRIPYFPNHHAIWKRLPLGEPGRMMEVPVSTLPPFGLPLTASAVFALGSDRVIELLARRHRRQPLLMLLHGVDLVDCTEPIVFDHRTTAVAGFNLSLEEKRAQLEPVLRYVCDHYHIARACDWVQRYTEPRTTAS